MTILRNSLSGGSPIKVGAATLLVWVFLLLANAVQAMIIMGRDRVEFVDARRIEEVWSDYVANQGSFRGLIVMADDEDRVVLELREWTPLRLVYRLFYGKMWRSTVFIHDRK